MANRICIARAVGVLALAALLFAVGACAKRPPKPVPVSGKVVRDGKGMPGMRVVFWPREPNLLRVEAASGPGGEFSLECPPGTYLVTVNPGGNGPPIPDSGMPTTPESNRPNRTEKAISVPDRFQERKTTPLNIEVPAEGKNDVLLDIGK